MAKQHIRGLDHRLRLPMIEKSHTKRDRKARQDDLYFSVKNNYYHDYRELVRENEVLKQRLQTKSDKIDEYDYIVKCIQEETDTVIQLQDKEIRKLLNKNIHLDREIEALTAVLNNNNYNDTDDDKGVWMKERNRYLNEIERMKDEKVALEHTLRTNGYEVKLCKQRIKELEKEQNESKKELEETRETASKNSKITRSGYRRLERRRQDVNDEDEYHVQINALNKQVQHLHTKLQDTEAELNETKSRLSKAMGERLTDNNPNIADLNDRNRPTKLAERYVELYDNQWTDAFDVLIKEYEDEEKTIGILLHILQDAENFCRMKAREQMTKLRCVLELSDVQTLQDITSDVNKILKDCRKAMSSSAIKGLHQMYMSHLKTTTSNTLTSALNVKDFTKECLEICWYMVVQDPPVSFAAMTGEGSVFNTDLYKAYTRSGPYIAYVVWPPLLLHDNGPVLTKGVAQGSYETAKTEQSQDKLSYI